MSVFTCFRCESNVVFTLFICFANALEHETRINPDLRALNSHFRGKLLIVTPSEDVLEWPMRPSPQTALIGLTALFSSVKSLHFPLSVGKMVLFDVMCCVQVVGQLLHHSIFANLIVPPLFHDHVLQALKLQDVILLLRKE